MKTILSLLAGLSLLTLASASFAQTTQPAAATADSDSDSCVSNASYCYTFVDDLLNAPGIDSTAPLLRVRPVGLRERLLRPRTQFVREMLKSVETL